MADTTKPLTSGEKEAQRLRLRRFYAESIGLDPTELHPAKLCLTEEEACAFARSETVDLCAKLEASENDRDYYREIVDRGNGSST